jgi:uncharacterized protein (DUF488 family)
MIPVDGSGAGSRAGGRSEPAGVSVHTIGHSNHPLERFIRILHVHRVRRVADIRSVARSRRHPHFSTEPLRECLGRVGVAYEHLPRLGGKRRPRPDSRNLALPAHGLRGYADHMETRAFREAVDLLLVMAGQAATAVLCAEADWRRCHRSLLADWLHARGVRVLHIRDESTPEPHDLTPHVRVEEGRVSYPGDQRSLF